jgi:hypothetical protein
MALDMHQEHSGLAMLILKFTDSLSVAILKTRQVTENSADHLGGSMHCSCEFMWTVFVFVVKLEVRSSWRAV